MTCGHTISASANTLDAASPHLEGLWSWEISAQRLWRIHR
jgi:hypothetical protein